MNEIIFTIAVSTIAASAIAVFLLLLLLRLRYNRLIRAIWRSLKIPSTGLVFTPDMVSDLDEPVQKYFLHAIEAGTPLAAYVELEMSGSLRTKPDVERLAMHASQIVSSSGGFVWQANIGNSLMSFSGADYYVQK